MPDEMKSSPCPSLAAEARTIPLHGRQRPAFGWLAGVMSAIRAWRERHRQQRGLDALSDHMLDDIGIPRADRDRDGWRSFPRD